MNGRTDYIGSSAQGIELGFVPFAWLTALIKPDEAPPGVVYKDGHDHDRHKAEFSKQLPFRLGEIPYIPMNGFPFL